MEPTPETPSPDETLRHVGELEAELKALRAENAELRQRREELAIVARSARCLLWHSTVTLSEKGDPRWNIRVFNEQSATFDQVEGIPEHSWAKAWYFTRHPDDIPRMDRTALEALTKGHAGYRQEFRSIGKDREMYWIDEDVRIARVGENEWNLFGVCTEITERKRAEAELHYAITEARCLLWHSVVYEYDGTMTWNVRIPNERSVREMLPILVKPGQSWADAWYESKPEGDRARMDTISNGALRAGKQGYEQEYRCRLADGQVRWMYEVVRIERQKVNVWHLVGVCADITERKKSEEERERLIDELQRALAEVKQLSGMLPICASCKRVRDDAGYWNQIEVYIKSHADVQFSHGICPECMSRLYPGI